MRGIYLVIFVFLAYLPAISQTLAKNDELKFDADYFLMRKEFEKSLDLYLTILRSEPENADIKHRIGICYLHSEDEKEKAIPYLEEAVKLVSTRYSTKSFKEFHAPIEAFFLLGSAYRVNNQLDEAIDAYKRYREYLDPKDEYNLEATDQYIRSCELARELQKKPRPVTYTNLGGVINNSLPNFNPVISGNGRTLVYTTPARQGYSIYMSTFGDSAWTEPRDITTMLGTGKYMKTSSLSYNGIKLLLVQEDPENSDIFISHYLKGRWSKVEPLPKPINSSGNETHASFSPDGKTLYFTSVRKGGEGDLDIYRSSQEEGIWGKPINLGPDINTPYNEETPFVSGDGNLLYFSSEGHASIGGYDVFRYDFSHPEKGAVNLGYPINTTDNNLFYVPGGSDSTAYYAFAGPDSYGGRDIYAVNAPEEDEEEEAAAVAVAVEEEEEEEEAAAVAVVVEEKEEEAPAVAVTAEEEEEAPAVAVAVPEEKEEAGRARSYAVQFMALRNPVDLRFFRGLSDIAVSYRPDAWYRYTWLPTTDSMKAVNTRRYLAENGYSDAFIRRKKIIPRYTVQVMAVPGPVTDLTKFSNLPDISAMKWNDKFCRYTSGEYENREDAVSAMKKIRTYGYARAFVRKIRIED